MKQNKKTTTGTPSSILVIGASGRLGVEIVRQLAEHRSKPQVHAFCRDPSALSNKDRSLCDSIIQGNARRKEDIEMALNKTKADFVITTLGDGGDQSNRETDICTVSAQALANVMQRPEYSNVRAVVVSRNGAGGSRIIVGFGVGTLSRCLLWKFIRDHTNQEAAFKSIMDRTDIVRPTGLTDNKATGKVHEFGDRDWCPSFRCDRKDAASWIVRDIYRPRFGGKFVNISTRKMH